MFQHYKKQPARTAVAAALSAVFGLASQQAFAQAGFMRAAVRCRDQVNVRLAHYRAIFCPCNDPCCAFAFGKTFGVGVRILFAFK